MLQTMQFCFLSVWGSLPEDHVGILQVVQHAYVPHDLWRVWELLAWGAWLKTLRVGERVKVECGYWKFASVHVHVHVLVNIVFDLVFANCWRCLHSCWRWLHRDCFCWCKGSDIILWTWRLWESNFTANPRCSPGEQILCKQWKRTRSRHAWVQLSLIQFRLSTQSLGVTWISSCWALLSLHSDNHSSWQDWLYQGFGASLNTCMDNTCF